MASIFSSQLLCRASANLTEEAMPVVYTISPPIARNSNSASPSSEPRYPKRKRPQVSYDEHSPDDGIFSDDEEEDFFLLRKQRAASNRNSRPLPKRKIFPFMNLPAELRNKIYEIALIDSKVIHITSRTKGYRRVAARCIPTECEPQYNRGRRFGYNPSENSEETMEHDTFAPNLLAVSKTIHAEAASYLYTQPIVVADNNALLVFLTQIGHRHAAMLRDITIKEWCQSRSRNCVNFPALSMLASVAANLERLNIACTIGYFRYHSWSRGKRHECAVRVARKVYRDCFPWLEAVGARKADPVAAIDMLEIGTGNFENKGSEREMALFRGELERLLQ